MSRTVRCGLIQASNEVGANHPLAKIKKAMIEKHLKFIEQAAKKRVLSQQLTLIRVTWPSAMAKLRPLRKTFREKMLRA
jgi:hypothetical protein